MLDASALVAFLFGEEGGERVTGRVAGAAVSTVNWSEVAQRVIAELGDGPGARTAEGAPPAGLDGVRARLVAVGLTITPFTVEDADAAAELRRPTRELGLSLGDRACLALARRLGVPAFTADRAWARLPAAELGVAVEVVR